MITHPIWTVKGSLCENITARLVDKQLAEGEDRADVKIREAASELRVADWLRVSEVVVRARAHARRAASCAQQADFDASPPRQ